MSSTQASATECDVRMTACSPPLDPGIGRIHQSKPPHSMHAREGDKPVVTLFNY